MVALWNRAVHYIFAVWFLLLSPSFVIFFFPSPNLSRHRLDVCHTATHRAALVRILQAGLKHAARGSLKIQDANKIAKNRHLDTIAQLCRAIFATKARIDNWKKNLLSSNITSKRPTIW